MKYILLIILLSISFKVNAAELVKVTEHPKGWTFNFFTTINGKKYPMELPFNKCVKTDVKKECFATKREATAAAWAKAKKAEKMMREALSSK